MLYTQPHIYCSAGISVDTVYVRDLEIVPSQQVVALTYFLYMHHAF